MIPAWHPRNPAGQGKDPGEPNPRGGRGAKWWAVVVLIILIPATFAVWAASQFDALLALILPGYGLNWVSTADMREQDFKLVGSDDRGQWHLRLPRAYLMLWNPGDGRTGDELYLHMAWPDLRPYPVVVTETALRRPELMGKRGTSGDRLWRLQQNAGLFDRRIMVELRGPTAWPTDKYQKYFRERYDKCEAQESGIPGLVRLVEPDKSKPWSRCTGLHEYYAAPIGSDRYEVEIECDPASDKFGTCSVRGGYRNWAVTLTFKHVLLAEWRNIWDGVLARLDAATMKIYTGEDKHQ